LGVFISASVWFILVFFQAHLVYFRETKAATLNARCESPLATG